MHATQHMQAQLPTVAGLSMSSRTAIKNCNSFFSGPAYTVSRYMSSAVYCSPNHVWPCLCAYCVNIVAAVMQQVIAEAKQHHTKQLVAQLTRHIHEADRAVQGAAANALSQLDTSGSVPVEAKDELMVSPTHNTSGSVLASMFPADGHALSEMLQANSLEMEVDTEGC